jgi:chemotaxis protein CheC
MVTKPKEPSINLEKLQAIVSHGFDNAAKGFSGMIGQKLQVANPSVRSISLQEIPMVLGGPENDAVGIYLRVEGDMAGQVIIILPLEKAFELADMLLEQKTGTTKELGSMELSALAEVGNLTGTFFLNAMSELTGVSARPTPPAVMVDMIGSIMDVIIATMGDVTPKVLMFQSNFVFGDRQTEANFWIIPDPTTLEALKKAG